MKRQKILYLILIIFTVFLLINNLINIKLIGEKIEEIKRIEERLKQLEQEIQQQKRNIERILQGKLEVVATAYTSNLICCGKDDGITASGKKATWGTIAMDKRYKFGTKVYIPLFKKTFVVLDRGGAIKGNRMDIWFPTYEEVLEFGVKKLTVYIVGGAGCTE